MSDDELKPPAFLPPVFYLAVIALAYALSRRIPLRITATPSLRSVGLGLVALAVLLASWAFVTFKRAGTAVNPKGTASALVRHGPFRLTRNPMYLALTVVQAAASLALNTWWPLILLPVSIGMMTVFVIQREERRLEHWFGDDYRAYRREVRRWI